MIRTFVVLLCVALALSCNVVKNQQPLVDEEPRLVKSVANGQKYIIGDPSDPKGNYLYIANLKGTHKEMGHAMGEMFAEEINDNLNNFYDYYIGQLEKILEKKIPKFLVPSVVGGGRQLLYKVLDLNVHITKKYTNPRYFQEAYGIAEGSKNVVKAKDLLRLNIFPELIKAACTVAGVWNKATMDHQTLHVRALDWDSSNPISKFPTAIIYHPSDSKIFTHANFGWAGFIGSMTGISEYVSLGEKVWLPPKNSVKMTRYGNPWTYVFRDILYEAKDIKSALQILTNAHRTCAIHIGLASATDHSFRMFEYAQHTLNNYDDKNYTNYGANHPKTAGIAYFDKHVQPSKDNCVGQVLTDARLYGNWEAESLWRYIGLSHSTGDTQLAVFDLENKLALVSYSSADATTKAYLRSPIKVDLKKFFAHF